MKIQDIEGYTPITQKSIDSVKRKKVSETVKELDLKFGE